MKHAGEEGQAVVMVALAMGISLIGAVGLAVDGAHLYAEKQMAQTAADAAAQAAVMSMFDSTAGASGTGFTTTPLSSFICTTTDTRIPCAYAIMNGYGSTSSDVVTVDFPGDGVAPGIVFSNDASHLVRVTVQRTVNTTLMRLLGPTSTTIKATAMAAMINILAPTPILVTHPTLSAALSLGGTANVTICGGPNRSLQINSNSATAVSLGGSTSVNLVHAGPLDTGNCTTGTGADLGVWGGPSSAPVNITFGSVGSYMEPASPIRDPLATIAPPPIPPAAPAATALANGTSGCPAAPKKPCVLYSPGLYTGGIDGKNSTPVMKPGIYYIQSTAGMSCSANCDMYMATGFTDGITGTGTGWTGNILVYNTGPASSPTNAGPINLGANGSIFLVGSPASSAYRGILFFQDPNSVAQSHSLGGGGALQLVGTLYLTNSLATMTATPSQYQGLTISGNSGSSTTIQGEIIAGTLSIQGSGGITMSLDSGSKLLVTQIALVN